MLNRSILRGGAPILLAVLGVLLGGCCGNPCNPCDPCADPCDPCMPCNPCASAPPDGMPAGVQAGEAWCRIYIPPRYEEVTEEVCCQPATCRKEWVEPVYENRTKQVCVCPEQVRKIPVPAVFEAVEE